MLEWSSFEFFFLLFVKLILLYIGPKKGWGIKPNGWSSVVGAKQIFSKTDVQAQYA